MAAARILCTSLLFVVIEGLLAGSIVGLPGPLVYVVTPSPREVVAEQRGFPGWGRSDLVQILRNISSTTVKSNNPDIVMAEFQASDSSDPDNPKSIRQLLAKEQIAPRSTTMQTTKQTTTTQKQTQVKDIWDIIKGNEKFDRELEVPKQNAPPNPVDGPDAYTSRAIDQRLRFPYAPQFKQQKKYDPYGAIPKNELFTTVEENQHEKTPVRGEAQDRYNPAQPHLPDIKYGAPTGKPYAVMAPPPPPPQTPMMRNPAPSYQAPPSFDSYPSFDSPPYQNQPPSDNIVSYQPPPPPPAIKPSESFYPTPPSDMMGYGPSLDAMADKPPPNSDDQKGMDMNYPDLIFDDKQPHGDHHDHHFKHHDFDDFFHDHDHHYHHHHPTTTTTTTTEKPESRVNNRYSYYYIGKKLWYLPLYFSVYFIIYVGALIIKAVLRHKITYPSHYRNRRMAEDWRMKDNDLHELTRKVTNAVYVSAQKYLST